MVRLRCVRICHDGDDDTFVITRDVRTFHSVRACVRACIVKAATRLHMNLSSSCAAVWQFLFFWHCGIITELFKHIAEQRARVIKLITRANY